MPRRKRKQSGRQLPATAPKQQSYRSHWRADGSPKTRYSAQRDALSFADERRMDEGIDLNVYSCDHCGGWHVGNATDQA